jgi:hypothetical protein
LVSVARRYRALDGEIVELDADVKAILNEIAAPLLALRGVGYDTAGQLLVTAGDNPHRLRTESSYAALCASSPVKASSGKTRRQHRLNRGGDRQANSALWTIVLSRMSNHQPTRNYVDRRTKEGLSKPEIMRCLKRYVAREVFPYVGDSPSSGQRHPAVLLQPLEVGLVRRDELGALDLLLDHLGDLVVALERGALLEQTHLRLRELRLLGGSFR